MNLCSHISEHEQYSVNAWWIDTTEHGCWDYMPVSLTTTDRTNVYCDLRHYSSGTIKLVHWWYVDNGANDGTIECENRVCLNMCSDFGLSLKFACRNEEYAHHCGLCGYDAKCCECSVGGDTRAWIPFTPSDKCQ